MPETALLIGRAARKFRSDRGYKWVRDRPIDNAAYLGIDCANNVLQRLDLLEDQLELFRAERLTVQKFHWHVSPTAKSVTTFLFFRTIER